jgi:hypothetical protein
MDDFAAQPLVFLEDAFSAIMSPPFGVPSEQVLWQSTDLSRLREVVLTPTTEKLGAKPLKYLHNWKATCGGETFMLIGMRNYWKDALSADKLKLLGKGKEIKFDELEEEEFMKLLQEELDQGIVKIIPIEQAA